MTPRQITLANLPEATAQEVFDWVAYNLLTQNRKSVCLDNEGDAVCRYRGEDGAKCAAGWLMADDEYKAKFEGASWCYLTNTYCYLPETHMVLIGGLQCTHDGFTPSQWRVVLERVAEQYELSPAILEQFK